MYQTIGIAKALTFFATLSGIVFVVWLLVEPPPSDASLHYWWGAISKSVAATALMVAALGQSPIFPYLCKIPGVSSYFPDISGKWRTVSVSNWAQIRERLENVDKSKPVSPINGTVTIKARLFFIRMNLETDTNYSTSKTLFVNAARDAEDGSIELRYIYLNSTLSPELTDSSAHSGAACVTIRNGEDGLWMEGAYWTNRNWRQGLNTAGTITFKRSQ